MVKKLNLFLIILCIGLFSCSPKIQLISDYFEGLAVAKKELLYGFVDANKNVVIDFQFEEAKPFSEGLAAVSVKSKWGFINKNGRLVISAQFEKAGSFKEKLAPVSLDGKFGYISLDGKMVIEPLFSNAEEFLNQKAKVSICNESYEIDIKGDYKQYMQKKHLQLSQWMEKVEDSTPFFYRSEVIEPICFLSGTGCCGYVNAKYEIKLPLEFKSVGRFDSYCFQSSIGGCGVKLAAMVSKNNRWFWVDEKGFEIPLMDFLINDHKISDNENIIVINPQGADLLENPQVNSKVIQKIPYLHKVRFVSEDWLKEKDPLKVAVIDKVEGKWVRVNYNKLHGFIFSAHLSSNKKEEWKQFKVYEMANYRNLKVFENGIIIEYKDYKFLNENKIPAPYRVLIPKYLDEKQLPEEVIKMHEEELEFSKNPNQTHLLVNHYMQKDITDFYQIIYYELKSYMPKDH